MTAGTITAAESPVFCANFLIYTHPPFIGLAQSQNSLLTCVVAFRSEAAQLGSTHIAGKDPYQAGISCQIHLKQADMKVCQIHCTTTC